MEVWTSPKVSSTFSHLNQSAFYTVYGISTMVTAVEANRQRARHLLPRLLPIGIRFLPGRHPSHGNKPHLPGHRLRNLPGATRARGRHPPPPSGLLLRPPRRQNRHRRLRHLTRAAPRPLLRCLILLASSKPLVNRVYYLLSTRLSSDSDPLLL
jgi:hypothetical protein